MGFQFSVSSSGRLPAAKVIFLEGVLEEGSIRGGDEAIVREVPDRRIRIKSVALVNSDSRDSSQLTLAIEEPSFPLSELNGKELISAT
jgi:hypothetical protein